VSLFYCASTFKGAEAHVRGLFFAEDCTEVQLRCLAGWPRLTFSFCLLAQIEVSILLL
jgi:hypothetical protein